MRSLRRAIVKSNNDRLNRLFSISRFCFVLGFKNAFIRKYYCYTTESCFKNERVNLQLISEFKQKSAIVQSFRAGQLTKNKDVLFCLKSIIYVIVNCHPALEEAAENSINTNWKIRNRA